MDEEQHYEKFSTENDFEDGVYIGEVRHYISLLPLRHSCPQMLSDREVQRHMSCISSKLANNNNIS